MSRDQVAENCYGRAQAMVIARLGPRAMDYVSRTRIEIALFAHGLDPDQVVEQEVREVLALRERSETSTEVES